MAIYRGPGGAGDSTDDAIVSAVAELAADAAQSATEAAASASTASTAASTSGTNATNAATSASQAATSATNANTSAGNASSSATNAASSATSAAASATSASNSAASASTSASNASSSASTAASNATAAATSASQAATSASNATIAYNNTVAIYGSTTAVQNAVNSASTSATNAANSATAAATSATNAASSASSAAAQASSALSSANTAATQAANAQSSANSAATSATNAQNSYLATQALYGSADALNTAVTSAANSATNAATSAGQASTSATNAANSATASANSATQAANSASSAAAIVTGVASNRPSIRPSLLLDFANTKQLDQRITFSRASTGTYYDGKTVVKAEENLLLQSQDFTTTWTNVGSTDSANTTTAPDGTSTADTLTENAISSTHDSRQTGVAVTSGLRYVWSIFAKKGNGATAPDIIQLTWATGGFGSTVFANYDISVGGGTSGTVTTTGAGAVSASIVDAGNGWYRCVLVADATATATSGMSVLFTNNNPTATRGQSYVGVTTADVFLWGAQLEQRSTVTAYTPTTTAPITNYIPALQTSAANVARFDHDPVTGESKGLLIEEQRTNLLTYSEQFDNAAWVKTRASITANTIVAPDGALTGDKLVESTDTNSHLVLRDLTFTANTSYTFSMYFKSSNRNVVIETRYTGNWAAYVSARFNLSTGTIDSGTGAITAIGNGWYRCSITATFGASTTTGGFAVYIASGTSVSYSGDGTSGLYIWGAQLEAGSFPTSYIPTVASQVTRSADSASMTGSNFSSWYSAGQGTVYSESAVYSVNSKTQVIWDLSGGSSATNLRQPQGTISRLRAVIGTTFSGASTGAVISNNTFIQAAVAWNGLSGRLQSGGTGEDVTSTLNLDATQLIIGGVGTAGSTALNGTIKRIAFWPKRLSNSELQGLTS